MTDFQVYVNSKQAVFVGTIIVLVFLFFYLITDSQFPLFGFTVSAFMLLANLTRKNITSIEYANSQITFHYFRYVFARTETYNINDLRAENKVAVRFRGGRIETLEIFTISDNTKLFEIRKELMEEIDFELVVKCFTDAGAWSMPLT